MKTVKIWVAVNKNQSVVMFSEEPKKNKKLGKWESNKPFVNSVLFTQLSDLMKKANQTWENEPQYFEIQIQK